MAEVSPLLVQNQFLLTKKKRFSENFELPINFDKYLI